jgi:hypothetical protein
MSLDHDLEDLLKTTAPIYRPAPGDLDSVIRVGRRRVVRRRVAGAAGSTLVLLAVVATTLSLTGPAGFTPSVEEVATTVVTTDGGVTVRVLDLLPDASTVVEGAEGFEILTQPDRTLTSFWDSVAEEFGWYPDLAVYRSVDGSNWTWETFQADVFDDVAFIVDAVVIDGAHTLLVVWNDESGQASSARYGILQTRDFSDWSSVDVQAAGPATLPEHLEWQIGGARLEAVGEHPAVVTTVVPDLATSARHNTWGYDDQTGWHGHTEQGEAIRIPLEDVTPVGTDPSRTVVQMLADFETDSWEVALPGPAEPWQVVVEIEFDDGRWVAVTTQPSANAGPYTFTVWTRAEAESNWIEAFEASGQQAYLIDGTAYTLSIEGSAHQVTRWTADGGAVPVGAPAATGGDGAHVLLAGEGDAPILTSGRTIWRYEPGAEAWAEYDVDFDGLETLEPTNGSDPEDELNAIRNLSEPDNNFLVTARMVGDAVLAERSMWAQDWWIFQID